MIKGKVEEGKVEKNSVNDNSGLLASLSERERLCVIDYFKRKSCKQTAREIGLSPKTVENYLRRANEKVCFRGGGFLNTLIEAGVFSDKGEGTGT